MRSRNKKFIGYREPLPKQEPKIKEPKIYKVNGYYIVGEDVANACKKKGMKVEEA